MTDDLERGSTRRPAAASALLASETWERVFATSRVSYNADGTPKTSTAPAGGVTSYSYTDGNHQLNTVTPPSGGSLQPETITYDGFGRAATITDGDGNIVTYTYDLADRVTRAAYTGGPQPVTVTYAYDAAGNLKTQADPSGTTTWTYNGQNLVTAKTATSGGGTLTYGYDGDGNLTTAADGGGTTTYTYSTANLLTEMTDPAGKFWQFAYNSDGLRTTTWFATPTPTSTATWADLVWYGAAGNRTKPSITGFGILDGFRGVLVRDDYGGYLSYDTQLAGVQQCLAHLYRYLDDACATGPAAQVWTGQAGDALREAATAVRTARNAGRTSLGPVLLAGLRHRYDQAVAAGISANLSRRWHKGSHPGLVLARRLKRKARQVWLFASRFDVPPTNNGSENAIRGYKLAAKISGCWRTLATLQRHCRIRSYLTSARNHHRRPIDAIRDALTATCWMPPAPT